MGERSTRHGPSFAVLREAPGSAGRGATLFSTHRLIGSRILYARPRTAVSKGEAMGADSQIGVTGLAVMGANLARNIARHGVPIAVHNRTARKTERVHGASIGAEGAFTGRRVARGVRRARSSGRAGSSSWSRPGAPVDGVIDELAPLLDEGDIIIDARQLALRRHAPPRRGVRRARAALPRHRRLRRRGGRAARARASCPAATRDAYGEVEEIFTTIAAQVDGEPCCAYIGAGRRRPLREDGPQRHRVRRHAADRRGLRPAAPRRRARRARRSRGSSTTGTAATSSRS